MRLAPNCSWLRPSGLALLILITGCPSKPQPVETGAAPPSRTLVLVLPHDCCQGAAGRALTGLERALDKYALVTNVRLPKASAREKAAKKAAKNAERFRAALKQANELYLTMRMDKARQLLGRLLKKVRRTTARGLNPSDLAQVHLYLAALGHAQRWKRSFKRHCAAAVGYDPELALDPDAFSPPVQEAIEQSKKARQSMEVVVRSEPTGATTFWDGLGRGSTPARIPDQAKGRHYLIVEHPLYQTRSEEILLSTGAELQVKLKPGSTGQIIEAMAREPELREKGIALLGVDAVVWVDASQASEGLRLDLHAPGTPGGKPTRTLALALNSPEATIDRTAKKIAMTEGPVPTRAPAPASSQPAAPTSVPVPVDEGSTRGEETAPSSGAKTVKTTKPFWKRYWWAWAIVGVAVVGTSIALPVALSGDDPEGRGVVLRFPK